MSGAAIFDLDRTLLAPPSSERAFFRYLLKKGALPLSSIPRAIAGALVLAPRGPIAVTKANKHMWRGWSRERLEEEARACFEEHLKRRIYPQAWSIVRDHKQAGDLVVLLSGTLDLLLAPFAEAFGADLWIPSRLRTVGGRLTGELEGVHPYGPGKREIVEMLLREHCIERARAWAYADDSSDVALLSAVGHPVAVNPRPELEAIALRLGWAVERFEPAPRR